MSAQTKTRDYLFDNYKAFLIVLVVIGHFIEPCYDNNSILYTLKWFIFSFHMPAFIFISGYFSKRELPLSVLVKKLAVPYLVYQFFYYFLYTALLEKETAYNPLLPKFSLWYLLALFVWRALMPYVKKIPHYMIVSVAAGLFIGCITMKDNFLSIPRIIVYFPYFLAGISFDRSMISRFRSAGWKLLSAVGVIGFTALLAWKPIHAMYDVKIFYGRYNYSFLEQTIPEGILVRLVCYAIGFLITFAFMILFTERETIYSYIGSRTMAVYLFHGLIYSYLKGSTSLLYNVNTLAETGVLIVFCIGLSFMLTIPQLTAFTNAISSLCLPKYRAPQMDDYLMLTLSTGKL